MTTMTKARHQTSDTKAKHETSDLVASALDRVKARKARLLAKPGFQDGSRPDAEPHRRRGLARLKAATGGGATKVLRLGITNALSYNDYSAKLAIGTKGAVANVILDTGSSTLAVEPAVYSGAGDQDLKPTTLTQLVLYGTGGWGGPVVDTTVTLGAGAGQVGLPNCPIAITSVQQKGNFQGVTGIMGLAYNGLNTAYDFKSYLTQQNKTATYPWPFGKVWTAFYKGFSALLQRAQAPQLSVKPYFDQLEEAGVVANKFAFYTLRSWSSLRNGTTTAAIANDPLNNGYFILGGGEEQQDLYTGAFSVVTVLHDVYYNTNLKSVRVDGSAAHPAAALQQQYYQDMISNSIVDSGTSDLTLAQDVYQAILQGLQQKNPAFAQAIKAGANVGQGGVSAASLNLAQWPNIYFTLEGQNGQDVELACTPQTYWQIDFPAAGRAVFQISGPLDQANQSILGLPLLNNYYSVFDRTQDINGVIKFAKIKPPA